MFSQATKNLLDSSDKKNGKLLTMFVNQNILAPVYTDKILKTLCIHKYGDTRAVGLDWVAENGSSHRFSYSAWIFFMLTRHF